MRTLWRNQEPHRLTAKEFDILRTLVRRAPDPVDRAAIIAEVWPGQTEAVGIDDRLRQHVSALRRKLGKDDLQRDYIGTVPQRGYLLLADAIGVDSEEEPTGQPDPASPGGGSAQHFSRRTIVTLLVAGALAIGLLFWLFRTPVQAPTRPHGRLLARATSEGKRPKLIPLTHDPYALAISPAGDKVFAIAGFGRALSILRTTDGSVKTLALPQEADGFAVSRAGVLYIASPVEGIMVLDIAREEIVKILSTGGPVREMAIDPAGRSLFLAMGQFGIRRLSLDSGAINQITDRTCPLNVAIDHRGMRLYVAYQCSGPSGRPGHDSVEIFDAKTGTSLGIVNGPPMVGGAVGISPDDQLVLLDGQDACGNWHYDHSGCTLVPSHVFHLLRATDCKILHSFDYPPPSYAGYFADNSRFLLLGNSISVVDAAKYSVLERLDLDRLAMSAVFANDGSRFWVGVQKPPGLLEFDPERASCASQEANPAMFFPADGSFEDASDTTVLSGHGRVVFAPGRIGQAFFLDGHSYLSADSTGYYQLHRHSFSIAMFVKFASTEGEVALTDWSATEPEQGVRMLKSSDNHFIFQAWPAGNPITSVSTVAQNTWYHVAVTKTDDSPTLYVNGKAEAFGKPPSRFVEHDAPLLLGTSKPGGPTLHGWLDEIAFYNRGLTADEVGNLYQQRATGTCTPN